MRLRVHPRVVYGALALITIAVGLLVHFAGGVIPPVARDVAGDALWAIMITWIVSTIVPSVVPLTRGVIALAICWAVELSQLYHAPMIDAWRATTAGRLVLGSGFDPRDLAAYAAGVVVALFLDTAVHAAGTDNLHQ